MQIQFRRVCAAILAGALAAAAGAQAPDLTALDLVERATPDGPVALVDGAPVSREEFLMLYRTQVQAAAMQIGAAAVDDRVRTEAALAVLRELAQRELLHQEAQRRGHKVTEAELDEALKKRADAAAADGAPGLEGEDGARLREQLRRALLIRKARRDIAKPLESSVKEADIRAFFEREKEGLFRRVAGLHLRHILARAAPPGTPPTDREWEAAQKRIDTAEKRIRAGESFEAVARALSDAPDAARGGDLGLVPEAQLPAIYAEAARSMSPGDISEPLQSERAYHLLKLEAREDGTPVKFDEVKEDIAAALRAAKSDEAVDAFCAPALDDASRVRIFVRLKTELLERPAAQAATGS
jgi:parvulin-like peptidyl-prolyl isomerase